MDMNNIDDVKAAVARMREALTKISAAKPLIQKLQLAIIARDLEDLDKVTIEICDFQIEIISLMNGLPGCTNGDQQLASLRRLRKAIVEKDEVERAIAQAEQIGSSFAMVTSGIDQLSTMLGEIEELF